VSDFPELGTHTFVWPGCNSTASTPWVSRGARPLSQSQVT
jgi:hypothetical protein